MNNDQNSSICQVTVSPGTVTPVTIPSDLQVTGSGRSDRTIRIQASNPISLQVLANGQEACGAYTVLPIAALASNYLTVQYQPLFANGRESQIAVVAAEDVSLTFIFRGTVEYGGSVYPRDGDLVMNMVAYEAFQIQATTATDLSGTRIDATGRIAVFAGNIQTAVGDVAGFPYPDHVIEQMPPINAWGTTFGVVSVPTNSIGDRIKVIAQEDNTVFQVNGQEYTLQSATNNRVIQLSPGERASVISEKPILVVQFTSSRQGFGADDDGMPSMLIVPPVQQYRTEYNFAVPDFGSFDTQLMIVIDSGLGKEGLILDNNPLFLFNPQWNRIPATNYEGAVLSLSPGSHLIRHADTTVRFGAYIIGLETSNDCGYAYAAGTCVDDLTVVCIVYHFVVVHLNPKSILHLKQCLA